jgi:hypothetical protein
VTRGTSLSALADSAARARHHCAGHSIHCDDMHPRSLSLLCAALLACGDSTGTPTSTTTGGPIDPSTGTTPDATTTDATTSTTIDPSTGGAPTTGMLDPTTAADETTWEPGTSDPVTTDASTTAPQTTGPDLTTGEPVEPPLLAGYPAWVHFTNPAAHAGSDPTILDEIVRLIDQTPDTGTIRAAIHSLTVNQVVAALLAAKARGVTVLVAEDGSDQFDDDPSPAELAAALGADHVFCGDNVEGKNYGCITTDPSGIMHTKLYTFSQTHDPNGVLRDNVVWFGSANMTHATGAKSFNNTLTIYGDTALYDFLNNYFGQLFSQQHFANNNFYDAEAGRGYFVADTARVYASPDQDGDLVVNRLNDIEAGGDCEVRVAQSMIHDSRPEIIDLLVKLKQGDCKVWVVGSSIQDKSLAKLKAAGIPVRTNNVHDKLVIVRARFADSPDVRFLVFGGSHNWTYSANYRNDELFVRIESELFHDLYVAHFDDAYGPGTPL